MKKKRFTIKAIVLTAVLSVILTLGAAGLAAWKILGTPALAMLTGMAYIEEFYVGEADPDALADAALDAMVNSLNDRWSYYLDAEGYEALELRRDNAYVGIGVTVKYETDGLHIQSITPGGAAEAAGLQIGEIIAAVDGVELTGDNIYSGTSMIQGDEGTEVVLTVVDAAGTARDVTLIRVKLETDPVSYEMLDGNVGYVSLANFYSGSADRTKEAVEDLLNQGASALLFDVRDNPGGYLDEMLKLLDYLLPEGPIFQSGDRNGPNKTEYSDEQCVDVPMAVLVNENTYSAAELFAAQLRETLGAPIAGQPTFGKGHSQQTFQLPGGRGLNISTKTYYTGGGVSLIGEGIIPDEVVELTDETEDEQLAAALELLGRA